MTWKLRGTATAGLMFLSACATTDMAPKAPLTPWPDGAAESAARIENDIRTLSSDAYEGREAGTPGYDLAVDYVTAAYREIGLKPAGDGRSFLQQVPLRRAYSIPEEASLSIEGESLTLFADFSPSAARNVEQTDVTAEVVFVGYGIDAPSFGQTSYDEVDVSGKIVAVLPGVPSGLPSEERAHFNSFNTKRQTALAHGAAGMMVLMNFEANETTRGRMMQQLSRPTNLVRHSPSDYARLDAVVSVTRSGADKLFAGLDIDMEAVFAGEAVAMELGRTATIQTATRFEDYESPNVIAKIPGSDPKLKNEYVVLTAHLDHIGVLRTVEEGVDAINNGAMDNATGTSVMLEEARKFMADGERPRRSILFVALTAEEKGLLGSEYFARNPTIKASQMVANVNLDMPIIKHDFTDAIGFGAEHSSLKGLADAAGASMGVTLTPDPVPEMVLFVRSDHYSFVKVGVPALFLVLGFADGGQDSFQNFLRTDYHRPSDEADRGLMWDVAAKFAELNYRIAKEIANADERPTWNDDSFFGQTYGRKTGM